MNDGRPDPDALLADVQRQAVDSTRGHLRIYFGASAGVGKTCAMLAAARARHDAGCRVLVGVVETHGRSATAELLAGLPVLPARQVTYRERTLAEFDLDAALQQRPELLLLDELAHTNVPGSRHAKRWQDAEELLAAGIDVWTTLNVQHLESLNDVVAGITGVRVNETLPDTFFDAAEEVVLVDVTADELLARLASGRVYREAQAARAAERFFRKGNLIALRELALRRTAERVEDDVQAYRRNASIEPVWKTAASLLACIGPGEGSEQVLRASAQLANQLNLGWHAVYVETPRLQRLAEADRERILGTVQLARDLGATTAVLAGDDVATTLCDYARTHNIGRVVLGHTATRGWRAWLGPSMQAALARRAPELDLLAIGLPGKPGHPASGHRPANALGSAQAGGGQWQPYALAALACMATALLATPLLPVFDLANIVMLFLLTVVLVAWRFGRGPAVFAALVQVLTFDFFFVQPRFSLAVSDVQYLLTFAVMLATALVIGQLTAGLRFQARVAAHREARSHALYEFARELTGVLQLEQVIEHASASISRTFRADVALFTLDDDDRLCDRSPVQHDGVDMATAQWVQDHAQPAGLGTHTLAGSPWLYLPLKATMRTRGVLGVRPRSARLLKVPEQRQQLETFAALVATVLERLHYIDVAQQATLQMSSERLRNSLLSALSHDLRTPLAGLYGLSDALAASQPPLAPAQRDLVDALRQESRRMHTMVNDLLDMARLQAGQVRLNLQWQPVEEVVGAAIAATRAARTRHAITTAIAPNMPLLQFDAVLVERVLANLIENACRHAEGATTIEVSARVDGSAAQIAVTDDGTGAGRERMALPARRGDHERGDTATAGTGLGLAICDAIVRAHGGRLWVDAADPRGTRVTFTLPLGMPPAVPDDGDPALDEHEDRT